MTGTAEVLEKHFPFITPSHITIYYGKPFYVKELKPKIGNIRVLTLEMY